MNVFDLYAYHHIFIQKVTLTVSGKTRKNFFIFRKKETKTDDIYSG